MGPRKILMSEIQKQNSTSNSISSQSITDDDSNDNSNNSSRDLRNSSAIYSDSNVLSSF